SDWSSDVCSSDLFLVLPCWALCLRCLQVRGRGTWFRLMFLRPLCHQPRQQPLEPLRPHLLLRTPRLLAGWHGASSPAQTSQESTIISMESQQHRLTMCGLSGIIVGCRSSRVGTAQSGVFNHTACLAVD